MTTPAYNVDASVGSI